MRRPSLPSGSTVTSAPKWRSMRSVWSRVASRSIDRRSSGRVQAGEQHRRLDLGRGGRRLVDDRHRLARPAQRERHAPALGLGDDRAPPSAPADRGCGASAACASDASPSKVARDRVAAGDSHHQPRARPGVAEIEPLRGLDEAADAGAADPPAPRRVARHGGAERPAGRGGAQHVVAFEQALDPGLADREQAEDERPMRDRLVAGRRAAGLAADRAGRGCERARHRDARADTGSCLRSPAGRPGWRAVVSTGSGQASSGSPGPSNGLRVRLKSRGGLPFDRARGPRLTGALPNSVRRRQSLRGQTGTRLEAPMHDSAAQVLRPQQGSGRVPEMRHADAGERRHARCRRRSWRAPARPPLPRKSPRSRPRPAPRWSRSRTWKRPRCGKAAGDDDVDLGEEVATADDTFLEEEEEGEDDVTGLIDGDIEDDEETEAVPPDAERSPEGLSPAPTMRAPRLSPSVSSPAASQRRGSAWGHSSVGRALEWHSRGRRFDSAWLHQS